MDESTLLIFSVFAVLILGIGVPLIADYYIVTDDVVDSPLVSNVTSVIDDGVTIGNVTIWGVTVVPAVTLNPFGVLGDGLQSTLSDSFTKLSIYPDWLISTLLILVALSIFIGLYKLLPGT